MMNVGLTDVKNPGIVLCKNLRQSGRYARFVFAGNIYHYKLHGGSFGSHMHIYFSFSYETQSSEATDA